MGRSTPPRKDGVPKVSKTNRSAWPGLWEAWPLVLLVGLLWFGLTEGDERPAPMLKAASIVDRTPPRKPKWDVPPKEVGDVLKDMARGDCWTASARLRGIRKSQKESQDLRTLEGALFVCAGNGRAAAEAVDPLVSHDVVGEATWIRANAALLMGAVDDARTLLTLLVERDTKWRRSAEALLIRIDTL